MKAEPKQSNMIICQQHSVVNCAKSWVFHACLLCAWFFPAPSVNAAQSPQEDLPVLIGIEGAGVQISFAGTTNWVPAKKDQQLHAGDRLRTDPNSRALLQ